MTNSELKEYAAANRSRLKKQKVALGDLVLILVGEFVGKNGVIKGISVCGNDFTDPYYEVDMACEVPDKYKCRKTLIQPNNVIGGLSASDFEIICSRTPVSDIMEAEPKPKFNVGDKVVVTSDNDFFVPYVGKIVSLDEDSAYITIGRGRINVPIDRLTPYTEPTAEEGKEKEQSGYLDFSKGIKAVLDGDFMPIDTTPIKTNPIRITNDYAWQSYRMELAKAVAPAMIGSNYQSTMAFDIESFNDDVVRIVDGIVERLKNEIQ